MSMLWVRTAVAVALVAGLGIRGAGAAYAQATDEMGVEGMAVEQAVFGTTPDGRQVDVFTLTNGKGLRARIITLGGAVLSLEAPDRDGKVADIVLGFEDVAGYLSEANPYFGALIGRVANRIAKGRFTLDGTEYVLPTNDGPNQLHGGPVGFDKAVWAAEPVEEPGAVGVKLTHVSEDGDQGYPGTVTCTVVYRLTEAGALTLDYAATADKATPVNLTHHSYFNLAGHDAGPILDHVAQIAASRYTPVDETLIPIGELAPVAGTPFDFTQPKPIGRDIARDDVQLARGGGYDHNFVLDREGAEDGELAFAARVVDPKSGRQIEVYTTEPGMQLYTGNFLDGTITGKGGAVYEHRSAFCLETQHFPDAPNQPTFPSIILRPGETYTHRTEYRLGAAE